MLNHNNNASPGDNDPPVPPAPPTVPTLPKG